MASDVGCDVTPAGRETADAFDTFESSKTNRDARAALSATAFSHTSHSLRRDDTVMYKYKYNHII